MQVKNSHRVANYAQSIISLKNTNPSEDAVLREQRSIIECYSEIVKDLQQTESYASQPMSAEPYTLDNGMGTATLMRTEQVEELDKYRKNAEEDYLTTPISVLRYITGLERVTKATIPTVKDGWVSVEDRLPEIIEGKDYSENVFAWCNGKKMIMCRTWVDGEPESGYVWANCYDDINGEGIWDENYSPTHWQPLPSPPITE